MLDSYIKFKYNISIKSIYNMKEKKLPSDSVIIRRSYEKTYYLDGKWLVEVTCTPEYDLGTDTMQGGCGVTYSITEDEISSGLCDFRSNAMFGWRCKYCNQYHVLRQWIIPENVKDKVFYAEHPERRPVIISFDDYKKRKGKN